MNLTLALTCSQCARARGWTGSNKTNATIIDAVITFAKLVAKAQRPLPGPFRSTYPVALVLTPGRSSAGDHQVMFSYLARCCLCSYGYRRLRGACQLVGYKSITCAGGGNWRGWLERSRTPYVRTRERSLRSILIDLLLLPPPDLYSVDRI